MCDKKRSIAIIIGQDHHNGLNLARALGINGVDVHAMIISNDNRDFISKSKFVSKSARFASDCHAVDYIIAHYSGNTYNVAIFPYSDSAAMEIDIRYNELKNDFILPSINHTPGEIVKLMNKKNQYYFAKEKGIPVAETLVIDLFMPDLREIPAFPVIVKPVMSAEGQKKDIAVCGDKETLSSTFEKLRRQGYKQILLQQFLTIDYEIDIVAAFYPNNHGFSYLANRIIRRWPNVGGTTSFSTTITDKTVLDQCVKLLNKIMDTHFIGLVDIEVFIVNGELFLNEINWRNSGGQHRAFSSGFYCPYWWIESCINNESPRTNWAPKQNEYAMTELTDIRHVICRDISPIEWIKDCRRTANFAMKYRGDMKPVYYRYWLYIRKAFRNRGEKAI